MRVGQLLLDLFYPRTCFMCGERLAEDEHIICPSCIETLPRTWEADNRQNLVESAFVDVDNFVRGGAFCFFEKGSPYREMIHQMKYSRHPEIAEYLGRLAATEWQQQTPDFFKDIDLIMPIPLHPKKFRQRGYNQAEYICKGLSAATGVSVSTSHLVKVKNNATQTRKTAAERLMNATAAYKVQHAEELSNMHILLVDDIITTGATMQACISALSQAQNVKCSVFALGVAKGI